MVLPAVWAEKCERYSLSMPYKGRYCTGDGIVIPLDAPRLCRYQCILSATCKAYNYNATVGICTCFSSPCPQALGDPAMEFSVFTQRPYEQCYEWIPYNTGDSVDERMIYVDTSFHIIARRQMTGNDIVSYFHTGSYVCYGYFGSSFSSDQCQRMRIMEDCTILGSLHRPWSCTTQSCYGRKHGKRRHSICDKVLFQFSTNPLSARSLCRRCRWHIQPVCKRFPALHYNGDNGGFVMFLNHPW